MARRRGILVAEAGVAVLAIALLAYQALASRPSTPAAAPTAAPSAPTAAPAAAAPTAAPAAAAPTAAPAAAAPTAAPAAAAPTAAPAAVVAAPIAPVSCSAIAGLPVFAGANCVKQDSDLEDGLTTLKNSYTAAASPDEVRRFYEGAFAQGGWAADGFAYTIQLGQRRLKIDVETDQQGAATITKVKLTERGPAAATAAGATCQPIADLPAYTGATCLERDVDANDSEVKDTYSTSASPGQVMSFYADVLAKNGWATQSSTHDVRQGTRRLQVEADAQDGQVGVTELKIEEK